MREPHAQALTLVAEFIHMRETGQRPNACDYLARAAEHGDQARDELFALIETYLAGQDLLAGGPGSRHDLRCHHGDSPPR